MMKSFAHYAFAWIVLSMAQSAQVVINASVYPMLVRRYAEHGRSVAFRLCLRVCAAILVLGVVAAVPLGLLLDFSVRRWYPQVRSDRPRKAGSHRALDDIRESVNELRYYREKVFIPRVGPSAQQ